MPTVVNARNSIESGAIIVDGREAWLRLARAFAASTIGGVGMWSIVVALPAVSAEFHLERSLAALPYTCGIVGFALGGVAMGRLADRCGIMWPLLIGAILLPLGYVAAAFAPNLAIFALAHGLLIGPGASASFAPVLADVSLYFKRRRGIAVAVAACGNYMAGVIWPGVVQRLIESYGWRTAHLVVAAIAVVAMIPLSLSLRRRAVRGVQGSPAHPSSELKSIAIPRPLLQALLVVAGVACCVAMAMPQVHIVAYCGDLGYGAARGAEMLSLMLGCGIISRVASGFVADRIGGLATLLISSVMQGVSLLLFLFFDGLGALFVISALFGLVQGGIVPSYAVIVREYFPASEAGTRVSIVIMATLAGMALGGWLSGVIFDVTGSYIAAFLNGIGWNLLNVAIGLFLILRRGRDHRLVAVPA